MEKVLVTGGSGYVAQFVMAQALAAGYAVRTTVRNVAKSQAKVLAGLAELGADASGVEFVAADLTHDDGWLEAMNGIDFVLHVASPMPLDLPKDENDLIIPAKEGALRVMQAAHAAGVKRVVMTSAFGAVGMGRADNEHVFTEEDWAVLDGLGMNAYYKSKTLAERAVWDFADQSGLEVVTMLPVAVLGPLLNGEVNGSNHLIQMLLTGEMPGLLDIAIPIVDVRDVARAHVLALQGDAASERFILSNGNGMKLAEIARILRANLSAEETAKLPKRAVPSWLLRLLAPVVPLLKQTVPDLGVVKKMSNAKAQRLLNWQPQYSNEETLIQVAKIILAAKK